MNLFGPKRVKHYRAFGATSNQLTFVTNPFHYPVMDGDLVYIDTSQVELPIVAHSISAMCCQVRLMIEVEEVVEVKHELLSYMNMWPQN